MAREFASAVRFAQVTALPAAASNTGAILEQGGRLWFSDGSAWIDVSVPTGTSGATVPLLNGTNTWSGNNAFTGQLGIGGFPGAGTSFTIGRNITGTASPSVAVNNGIIQSDVTGTANYNFTALQTAAASFTTSVVYLYRASQGAIGAGSAVSTVYGFGADSSLTGATNNYGFWGNIAAGTGRWNLYMQGTAKNYLGGQLGIGVDPGAVTSFRVGRGITGAAAAYGQINDGTVQSDVTSTAAYTRTVAATAAASFTVNDLIHNWCVQGTFGAGSTVSNQTAFLADSSLTGATNNFGFRGDIAAGTGRWNFYAGGTANNYMAGALGIGSTVLSDRSLRISRNITGATAAFGVVSDGQFQSDVTGTGVLFRTVSSTQAAAFTLATAIHYQAAQGTIGAGSTVTTQEGFKADNSLVGATNNYGFRGSIPAGTGRWNFFADGTANNAFAGNVRIGSTAAPTVALDVTGSAAISGSLTVGGSAVSVAGHTHTAADITDFNEAVDDRVGALFVAGANVTLNYDDAANTFTISAATGGAPSFGNGSAAAPSLSPTTDPNTGWHFDGADKILVSIAGAAYGGWNTARSQYEVASQIGFVPASQCLMTATVTQNGYGQAVLQNFSAGINASTDLILANDAGTDSTNYIDLGINSTGYTGGFFGAARDGYVYVTGAASGQGSLWIGTGQASTKVRIAVGGGAASNVVCDFDANGINLPAKTGTVTAPADGLNLFNRKRAGRNTLRMLGPSGIETALQPALFGNTVFMWMPGTGTTLAINFGTSWTARNAGTGAAQAHPGRTSTNAITALSRATFTTGTTATGSSGVQSTNVVAWRGNAAGLGGFFFAARLAIETFASDIQVVCGLSALNAALAVEPSTLTNTVGLAKDSTDANWQIVCRDATAVTKTNTGIAVNATDVLDFFMFAAPNASSVSVMLVNAVTGAVIYENASLTANLPVATAFLYSHAQIRSTTGTTGKLLALNKIYIETDL